MSGCFISSPADWMVGSAMHVSTSGGPPAATMARLSSLMVAIETRLAEGCALKTTLLPAETMPRALQMMVDGGLVTGVIAPMTPKGAGSVSIRPSSPERAMGTRSSGPGVLFGDEQVLLDLVLEATEARLVARHPGERLGVLAQRRPAWPR